MPILLTVVVAREGAQQELGYLAIALALHALLVGLLRAFTTETLVFESATYGREGRSLISASTSAIAICGAGFATLSLGVGLIGPRRLSEVFLGLAILLVPTVVQEHLRMVMVATGRAMTSLAVDGVAAGTVAVGLVVVADTAIPVSTYLTVWAGGSVLFVGAACVLMRIRVSLRGSLRWMRSHGRSGTVFATDFVATAGLTHVAVLLVSVFAGAAAAAAMRGSQVLLTPISLVTRGAAGAVPRHLVGLVAEGDRRRAKYLCVGFSLCCVVGALVCGLWLVVPEHTLRMLLGDSASATRAVVVPAALALAAMGVAMGAGLYLRATGDIAVATRIKIGCFPVSVVGVFVGTLLWGAAGAFLGLAAGEVLRGALAWTGASRR